MFKFVIFSVCTFAVAQAAGYGGRSAGRAAASSGGGYGGSGGGAAAAAAASGYGGSYASGGGSGYSGGVIPAAIQTRHNIEFREVPSTGSIQPATIEVGASSIPLNILFRSASSSLNVLQHHQGAAGDTQESESEDEPHRLIHSVKRPIIQEINEVVTPYRKITQQIQPVQEEINTIVARGQQSNYNNAAGFDAGAVLGGNGGGGGYGAPAQEVKATSGSGLGKGLSKATSSGYASASKASSGTKGY